MIQFIYRKDNKMSKKEYTEYVDHISYDDIKIGQYVTLKDDNKNYVCVPKRTQMILIPIDLKKCIMFQKNVSEDLKPKIKCLFSARTGVLLKIVSDDLHDTNDEDGDDEWQ